jgi:Fe-S cluster assembly ATP-binding protein
MLTIQDLHVEIDGKEILKGIDLQVNPGEIHAIMGLNGSGKSTLAHVIAGRDEYEVTKGSITFNGQDLLELETDERAREGIFQAFQYPVEIPGVTNANFLKSIINASRKHYGKEELDAIDMLKLIKE